MQDRQDIQAAWDDFVMSGSERAYYVLYRHYHNYLLFIAIQRGVSIDSAKDKVNDLFLYVFEHREALNKVRHYHNYIVSSFLHNLFKKATYYPESYDAAESEPALESTLVEPGPLAERAAMEEADAARALIRSYIGQLSRSQREMIYQKFYLGLSYEAIASAKGVTVKTVYNTILRAVARLKELMEADETSSSGLKAALFSLGSFLL
ncbi:RNA polymerase sigma factor [Arachidicoccus terrestris]|uniref:RNA polymerase sigma factor n=1 Tax=Arachidicoccus terrestris TaxID=2875539 RepID=UPI001CC72AA4|nr:sigma-70 family RNA polymerase sigma factor [Arachidicoccus terrestris]UAY55749.1 sigma-70 family RNA polymerase sigma factor [Arachidicoccus terrestris]